MNLVSFEYIATQQKRKGVLILSEFAGAAQSLNGSIVINPWNTEELAGAYYEAVSLSDKERSHKFEKLYKYISKYTRYGDLLFILSPACEKRKREKNDANFGTALSGESHLWPNCRDVRYRYDLTMIIPWIDFQSAQIVLELLLLLEVTFLSFFLSSFEFHCMANPK